MDLVDLTIGRALRSSAPTLPATIPGVTSVHDNITM
jgi:hypothetical protein